MFGHLIRHDIFLKSIVDGKIKGNRGSGRPHLHPISRPTTRHRSPLKRGFKPKSPTLAQCRVDTRLRKAVNLLPRPFFIVINHHDEKLTSK